MRKYVLLPLLATLFWAVPTVAQPQNIVPTRVVQVEPVTGASVYPFGSIAVGTASSGIRIGPFGCYVTTADPTYTTGQIHPCSLTTDGKIRVDNGYAHGTTSTSTDKITMIGCVRNDAGTAMANDQQRSRIQCDSTGKLLVSGTFVLNPSGSFTIGNITGTVSLPTGAAIEAKQPGFSTFGTPSANVMSIQGGVGQTPVKSVLTLADGTVVPLASDATQGSAAQTSGPQLMAECDDVSTVTVSEGQARKVRVDCNTGAVITRTTDLCSGAKSVFVINIATPTTTVVVNGAGAANNVYVCGIFVGPTAGAQNLVLVEDDTAACASPTAGLTGGLTAASGWGIPANGGTNIGGGFTIAKTTALNRFVCFISSASQQTSGTLTYVLAP